MAKILIIDDDKMICDMLSTIVGRMGHEATYTLTLEEGIRGALSGDFDIVFLDVRMPDGSGLDALPKIRETLSSPEVIIITGFGDPDGAELAIKNGAWDYIEKPASINMMTLSLVRALQYREEKKARSNAGGVTVLKREGIIGSSPQIKASLDLLAQAANSNAGVMITGETGTGKELFALAIHENSSRARKNFVVVDCATLPETLVESVLFGHEKGAFTGADKARDGLVKQADGGTLFLDEVGELPLSIQRAFLRVLQEHRFRPLGGKKEIESDFRLVASTNRDLDEMVRLGQFRNDLLFRLRSIAIELPALRDRREDIKELLFYYMARLCENYGIGTKGFSADFLEALTEYDWPGNVRELINTMNRALAAARDEPTLFRKHLPTNIRVQIARASISKEPLDPSSQQRDTDHPGGLPRLRDLRDAAIAEAEKQYMNDLMLLTGGNIKDACKVSGLSRPRLYALLNKYELSRSGLSPSEPS
jgi:two-component system NtrC family response regulator